MYPKILLIVLSAAAFSSCSTAYKSGQTPDDVYYSPLKVVEENSDKKQDDDKTSAEDRSIRMRSRDPRWRDFDRDYDYDNSPYHYCYCNCHSYGYYYNPNYYPGPVYSKTLKPVNSTPRQVNLNAYNGLSKVPAAIPKYGNTGSPSPHQGTYNNSNSRSGLGNTIRQIFSGDRSSSSSNTNRTYTPSSGSSSTGKSSSGSSSGSGSVSRPNRGG